MLHCWNNVATMLQRSVVLKIVVANRLVYHHLHRGRKHMTTISSFFCGIRYSPLEFNSSKTYDKLEELKKERWNLKQRESCFWVKFSLPLLLKVPIQLATVSIFVRSAKKFIFFCYLFQQVFFRGCSIDRWFFSLQVKKKTFLRVNQANSQPKSAGNSSTNPPL